VLNYSLVLRITDSGPVRSIPATNQFVLQRHRDALAALFLAPVEWQGQTDLAIGGLKFGGNAQRRRRRFLLFHGSFLLHLDIGLVEQALPLPSRQPDYRINRSHADFLVNLKVSGHHIKDALVKTWQASAPMTDIPYDQITRLAREKYSLDEWNLKF
jgi:lipoate-protein ligase A